MFKITEESVRKLAEINNLMNQLEIRGISNAGLVYKTGVLIQEIILDLDKNNKEEIIIDNTKKGG
jgi:Ribonuclease G/E